MIVGWGRRLGSESPLVIPQPADLPECAAVTGYWFLDQNKEWCPPADLQDFLDAGAPPVYIGFGSMSGRDPARLTRKVVDALCSANVRGILATGWGRLDARDLPDTVFRIEQAPHDWIQPRVAAVALRPRN
jgi:sterol 3beta-glucosyltransferase